MRNLELAALLGEISALLEVKGDNPYRIRAYKRAAEAVQLLSEDVADLAREGRLESVKGIGKGIAAAIQEWLETGDISLRRQLLEEIPRGVLELMNLPGVGPKTAAALYREAGIDSRKALQEALEAGRLQGVKGVGPKTREALRKALTSAVEGDGRFPIGVALSLAWEMVRALRESPWVLRVEVAGSLRRYRDTVKDIDLVVASHEPQKVMGQFISLPGVREILQHGTTKSSVRLYNELQADLRVVAPEAFPSALHHFTGSQAHHIRLRERAQRLGLRINEYGITRLAEGETLYPESEEALYQHLGLAYIPPELREDRGEIEAAQEGKLPRLVQLEDLRGDLHVHSVWSDGRLTLEELAREAVARGWRYVAVTDHSPNLRITGGLDAARLERQAQAIAELRERFPGLVILRGIEVDILADGTLDLPDEVLARLDVVVASVHTRFQQDRATMTRRILKAIENPHVDIIAHPTGRILGRRPPFDVDMEAIIEAAVRTRTALEINSSPERLDLKDEHVRQAVEAGALLAINSDMHQPVDFENLALGVAVARRGWATAEHVVNTWDVKRLEDWLNRDR